MAIPTEPIGSIPRPRWLIEAAGDLAAGRITAQAYGELADRAVREDGRCLTAEVTKVDQNYPDGRLLVVGHGGSWMRHGSLSCDEGCHISISGV